jgi:NhaP-type Na+/H+ or K+/H+ antiporter
MALYEISLLLVALAIFSAIFLPRWFADKPLSYPIFYVGLGFLLFSLPIGIEAPDPIVHSEYAERLTQLVVIVSLMGAGLKIDRPFDVGSWVSSWRLLAVTMPLTIMITALLGWGVLDLLLPTAVLLGAVLAPTDPVLASDVAATRPNENVQPDDDPTEKEGLIRFALTSEAGLNDGLAFPFTYLAIATASIAVRAENLDNGLRDVIITSLLEWLAMDLFYRIIVGVAVGYAVGKVVAYLVFGSPSTTDLTQAMEGSEALAATLFAYAVAELIHGYGFIAVFISALVLRSSEWEHEYYKELDDFAIMVERLLMAAVLVLFGGTISGGLLAPLTWQSVAVGLAFIFVVRPLAGIVGLIDGEGTWRERAVIAFFGIRGIGSFYYLAFALHEASFQEFELLVKADLLWALTGFVVLTSMFVHGATATAVMNRLDDMRGMPRKMAGTETD